MKRKHRVHIEPKQKASWAPAGGALVLAALAVGVLGGAVAESAEPTTAMVIVRDTTPAPVAVAEDDLWQRLSGSSLGEAASSDSSLPRQAETVAPADPPRLSIQVGQSSRPAMTESRDRVVPAPEGVEIRLTETSCSSVVPTAATLPLGQYRSPAPRQVVPHAATRIELTVGETSTGHVLPVEHRTTADLDRSIPQPLPGDVPSARPLESNYPRNTLRGTPSAAYERPRLQPLLSDSAAANPLRNGSVQPRQAGSPLRLVVETSELPRAVPAPAVVTRSEVEPISELNQLGATGPDRFDRLTQATAVQSEAEAAPSAEMPRPLPAEPAGRLPRVVPMPEPEASGVEQTSVVQPAAMPCWEAHCKTLEKVVAELFPTSQVKLVPVAGELFVAGRVASDRKAAQLLAVVRDQVESESAAGVPGALARIRVVNMLQVPDQRAE